MRKNGSIAYSGRHFSDRRWFFPFLASLVISAILFLAIVFGPFSVYYGHDFQSLDATLLTVKNDFDLYSIDSEELERRFLVKSEAPRLAYFVTGTKGDSDRMKRTLQAIYHPRNQYILHLDLEAPPRERIELAMYVKGDSVFSMVENVRVISKGNLVTYRGPTMIACTLHAIAILLKERLKWDWFINLSASDYPLMPQDDILHVFSSISRDLNFIEHTQSTGWKVNQRAKPIIIDPGLYLSKKFDVVFTNDRRELPTSFKLFTGSAWVMLSRAFLDYCIWGWDSFPRNILMYYANFISSPEGYFHTVICNSEEFQNTTISHDLHYIAWDSPPKQHPRLLSAKDFKDMVKSGAPFARKFPKDDPVLDRIDRELLHRSDGRFTPGAWCAANNDEKDQCLLSRGIGNDTLFNHGRGSERLRDLINKVVSLEFRSGSCSSLGYDQTKREWIRI